MTARVVFLGTPGTAVSALQGLIERYDIRLVVTRPDRPRGRSGSPRPSPVKVAATDLGIDIAQPTNRTELNEIMLGSGPFDVGVVVAFGMLIDDQALEAPAHGMVNCHFSLLPRWRGAAPVARALMAGDTMSGVTIIKLDQGLDTGPVLTAQAVDIGPDETAGELEARLATSGANLLSRALPAYLSGDLEPIPQSDEGVTYAAKLEQADRPIHPGMSMSEVVNRVRGLSPKPGATMALDGTPHRVLRVRPHPHRPREGTWEVVAGVPVVGVADGGVELVEIQAPGRNVTTGADWARGRRVVGGSFE